MEAVQGGLGVAVDVCGHRLGGDPALSTLLLRECRHQRIARGRVQVQPTPVPA